MNIKELKETYGVSTFYDEDGKRWYAVFSDISAIDAIRLVADKAKVSMDRIIETRGYIGGTRHDLLFLRSSWEKVPKNAWDVWALTVRE